MPRPRLKWSSQPRGRGWGWPGEAHEGSQGLLVLSKPSHRAVLIFWDMHLEDLGPLDTTAMACSCTPVYFLMNSSCCSFDDDI